MSAYFQFRPSMDPNLLKVLRFAFLTMLWEVLLKGNLCSPGVVYMQYNQIIIKTCDYLEKTVFI